MKIVWIKWRDSQFQFDQHRIEQARELDVAVFETVGFLLSEDKTKIVVAGDWLRYDHEVRCVTTIPRENVVKMEILRDSDQT